MSWDSRKFHTMNEIGHKMSSQNLQNLNDNFALNIPLNKPITFANYHVHRHHKKNTVSQISNFDRLKQTQPKGLVFVWPQRRKFYYVRELCLFSWLIAHSFFWLHVLHIFPNGSGMQLNQPPWTYKPPLPKPQNRDYIIEPDWDSSYNSKYDYEN